MTEETNLSDLFAQFDEVAEDGAPPEALPSDVYTKSRTPGLWNRLAKQVIQGPALLAIYLAVFFAFVGGAQEAAAGSLGLVLVLFIMSPLLGRRPLAQPARWGAALTFATLLASMWAVLGHWPALLPESGKALIFSLALSACITAEKVTNPIFLLGAVLTGGLVYFGGRSMASRHPWLETRATRRPWRRVFSLAMCGLAVGIMASLPLLHHLVWNQTWIGEAKSPWTVPRVSPVDDHANSLSSMVLARDSYSSDQQVRYEVALWSEPVLFEKARLMTPYLKSQYRIANRDTVVVEEMLKRLSSLPLDDPTLADFVWWAYARAAGYELGTYTSWLASRAMRKSEFPRLARMKSDTQSLSAWKARVEALPIPQPLTRPNTDWALLRGLKEQPRFSTGNRLASMFAFQRPLKLFGLETSWTLSAIADDWEDTTALLVYSHRRKKIDAAENNFAALARPYTGIELLDYTMESTLPELTDQLPFFNFGNDRKILLAIIDLKTKRATTGRYPDSYAGLPPQVFYRGQGATARLFSPAAEPRVFNFDVTLK